MRSFRFIFLRVQLISFLFYGCKGNNVSGSYFDCPSLSSSIGGNPGSVHQLKPTDIRLVGAMGDSFTSGFGASVNGIMGNDGNNFAFLDNKGMSWSGGGDFNLSYLTTLPNILRMFNQNIKGFATGNHSCGVTNTCGLNVAERNATGRNLLEQAKELVQKAKEMQDISFADDWKLVTIYIGINDICTLSCQYSDTQGAEFWINNITQALNYLKDNLPRTFVNLVQLMNIGDVMQNTMFHSTYGDECANSYISLCTCTKMTDNNDTELEEFIQIVEYYQMMLQFFISSGQYDDMDNFTVVLQPFMKTVELREHRGDVDLSFFASDCFHPSPLGHQSLAMGLWNNMLEKVGNKTTKFYMPVTTMKCPTNMYPYLFTARNSISPPVTALSGDFQVLPVPNNLTTLWAIWIPPVGFAVALERYTLEVVCNDSLGFVLPLSHENITILLTGLAPASTYTCAVFANNRTERVSNYSTSTTWGGNAPSAPRELILTPLINSPTSLIATWLEPEYSNGVFEYTLHCNTISSVSAPFTLKSSKERIDMDNLTPFTNYTCTVRAWNNIGYSPYSSAAYAQTSQSGPSAPSIYSAESLSSSTVKLQWKAPEHLNGILKKYQISYYETEVGRSVESFVYTEADKLEVTITGLKVYTNYSFMVRGRTVEYGADSNIVTVITRESLPGPVGDLQVSEVTATSAKLSWSAPAIPNGVILQYKIAVFILHEESLHYEVLDTIKQPYGKNTLVLSKLLAYRKYQISVSAFTKMGEGDHAIAKFTTKTSTPSSPANLTAKATSSEAIFIKWNFPLYPRGIIRGYLVSVSESAKFIASDILFYEDIKISNQSREGFTSVTATELLPYTPYYVKVQAYAYEDVKKDIRFGDNATVGPVYTLQSAPSPPTKLKGNPDSSTSITLSWSDPEKINGVIEYYEVIYHPLDDSSDQNTVHVMSPNRSAVLSGLKMYTFYAIVVRAYTIEFSDNSSSIIVRTLEDAPSAPIIKLAKSESPGTIRVSWDPPQEMNGVIKTYTIRYYKSNGSEDQMQSMTTPENEVMITGLDPSTMYSIYVTASTQVAEGKRSEMMVVMTMAASTTSSPSSTNVADTTTVTQATTVASSVIRISWNKYVTMIYYFYSSLDFTGHNKYYHYAFL